MFFVFKLVVSRSSTVPITFVRFLSSLIAVWKSVLSFSLRVAEQTSQIDGQLSCLKWMLIFLIVRVFSLIFRILYHPSPSPLPSHFVITIIFFYFFRSPCPYQPYILNPSKHAGYAIVNTFIGCVYTCCTPVIRSLILIIFLILAFPFFIVTHFSSRSLQVGRKFGSNRDPQIRTIHSIGMFSSHSCLHVLVDLSPPLFFLFFFFK